MDKKDFFPFILCSYQSFSLSCYLKPQIIFPYRDIGPATATLDPRPRLWTRDRDFGPTTRDPRLLVKLSRQHFSEESRQVERVRARRRRENYSEKRRQAERDRARMNRQRQREREIQRQRERQQHNDMMTESVVLMSLWPRVINILISN